MDTIINNYLTTLNNFGRGFCNYSAGIFVQSSLLIILLLLIDFLLRKRVRATLRYWIWMLVFIKLILPPTLCLPTGIGYWCGDYLSSDSIIKQVSTQAKQETIEIPVKQDFQIPSEMPFIYEPDKTAEITESQNSKEYAEVPQISPPLSEIETATPVIDESPASNPVAWQAIVFLIWLVGVLIISVLLIQRVLFVRGLVAQSQPSDEELMEIMDQCRGSLGVRRNIELRLSGNISSPAVCGLINPAILVPQNLIKKLSPDKLKAVLIHELAHIKRGDLWINLAQTILQIIYFYNPFVWLTNAVVRRIREQAVDEMVLVALGAEAKSYSNTLIDIAEMAFVKTSLSLRLIGVVESKKALHQRIRLILNRPLPKKAKLGILGLLVVIIIGAILLPMAKSMQGSPDLVIKGVVKDAQTNEPIAGAKVFDDKYANEPDWEQIRSDQRSQWGAITNETGQYSFLTWPEHHSIKVEAPGYKTQSRNLYKGHFILRKKDEEIFDFTLEPEKVSDSSEFKATLPNGVTVELIGVCEHPSQGKQWWRPDGKVLEEPPYKKLHDREAYNKLPLFEIVYRLQPYEGVKSKVVKTDMIPGYFGPYPIERETEGVSESAKNSLYAFIPVKDGSDKVDLHISVGIEDGWKKHASIKSPVDQTGMNTDNVDLHARAGKQDRTIAFVTHRIFDEQISTTAQYRLKKLIC